jgi:hypothetical protein
MHYHIRWSTKEVLDWEAFESRAEAEAAAQQLVQPDETYTIIERDESCPRCRKAFKLKTSSETEATDPNREYPWQQAVLDAVAETGRDEQIRKVSVAQRQISARLSELSPTALNGDEQAAIRDALRRLRSLVPERRDKDESGEKKATA